MGFHDSKVDNVCVCVWQIFQEMYLFFLTIKNGFALMAIRIAVPHTKKRQIDTAKS